MKSYQRINNIIGWLTFAIAAYVYITSMEPTGSFWDCGEFIATADKLEVGHPPGAPLFLMLGRVFILFAGDNVKMYPVMVNLLSALMSAFTILFLFWTITHLARKIAVRSGELTNDKIMGIMGAGLVGALAYTFTDSFWFSAVEGEVYASSSFFTALVFWAILKWESSAHEKHSMRWIILIAYLIGLSIGVHLLSLLIVPAIVFVFYYKRFKTTTKGLVYTAIISMVILGLIQIGIVQGLVEIAAKFDLLFVNGFGLPFGSGILVYALLIIGGIIWGLQYTRKTGRTNWNTGILCFAFILIGYSSFAQIVIRSMANPPLDENNPENVFNFLSYLNREQYGERPLLYGQYYTARVIGQEDGAMNYAKIDGVNHYVEAGRKVEPVYDPTQMTLFPRMYSNQASHIAEYKKWADIKGDRKPTFFENIKFFIIYQVNEMYWRYFMWNFAGRQNDLQGPGGITRGNWISGIPALDAFRLGPQDKLPQSMLTNRARNTYYLLPFILGLIGLVYQYKKDKKDTFIVFLFFLLTGLAIVVYLNQYPNQPRERDYAYAGSFYAYAIWIGFGVLSIIDLLNRKWKGTAPAVLTTLLCLVLVPGIMAKENWNDHDRSLRYTSRDFAANYLNSCERNGVLFTNGDNDTFPLWYAQEVEGVRTDVRVVNLSLLNTDWYADQLKHKYYDSDPLDISWSSDKYNLGKRDYIPFYDRGLKDPVELKELIDFMGSDNPQSKARTQGGDEINYFPTKHFRLTVDSAAAVNTGTVSPENAGKIVKTMEWSIDNNYLLKNDLMVLNIIANNNWKRPIYFATTVGAENYLNLTDYFQLEGLAYRLVPIKTPTTSDAVPGRVATSLMYQNVMTKFAWGNMNNPKVYMDENNLRMTTNLRINFARLAEALIAEGKQDSAKAVLDQCVEVMPDFNVPYNYFMLRIGELYLRLAGPPRDSTVTLSDVEMSRQKEVAEKGSAIVNRVFDYYSDAMDYYQSLNGSSYYKFVDQDANQAMYIMQAAANVAKQYRQAALADKLDKRFMEYARQSGIQ
jgi:hypothetical protein